MPRDSRSQSPQPTPRRRVDRTRTIIDEFFARPPTDDVDIPSRLEGVDIDTARQLLIERLETQMLSDAEMETLMTLYGYLGVGSQRDRIAQLVLDVRCSQRIRAYACGLLANEDGDYAEQLMRKLSPSDRLALMDVPFIDMLVWVQADPSMAEQFALAMEDLGNDIRVSTFDRLEVHRRAVGTPAAAAYGTALLEGRAASLRDKMLSALIREAGADGIALVQKLFEREKTRALKHQYQAALFRMRTRAIDPLRRVQAPAGFAYVSSCDNHGDFVVLGCFDNPDGSISVADVCIRLGNEIRGGFVLLRQTKQDIKDIIRGFQQVGGGFTRVSLDQAATLVCSASSHGGLTPEQAQAALSMFERVPLTKDGELGAISPCPEPVTLEQVRTLLSRSEYQHTWRFTDKDLEGLGPVHLPSEGLTEAWLEQLAERLQSRGRRARILEMIRHMARWHLFNGEPAVASLCEALAVVTDKDFCKSPLVLALVERSFLPVPGKSLRPVAQAHPRQALRSCFFAHVSLPKGRDLARLDFAEVAYVALGQALQAFPLPKPVSDEHRLQLAYVVGEAFVAVTLGRTQPPPLERVERRFKKALQEHGLKDSALVQQVSGLVLSALSTFLKDVCSRCPVRCLDRARCRVSEVFFGQTHPSGPAFPDQA